MHWVCAQEIAIPIEHEPRFDSDVFSEVCHRCNALRGGSNLRAWVFDSLMA